MFAGAAKALAVRDRWIGWTEKQRLRNLAWVINNTRFLIFPWVRLKNLASHVLGHAARHVKDDWLERWGYGPVFVEFIPFAKTGKKAYKKYFCHSIWHLKVLI